MPKNKSRRARGLQFHSYTRTPAFTPRSPLCPPRSPYSSLPASSQLAAATEAFTALRTRESHPPGMCVCLRTTGWERAGRCEQVFNARATSSYAPFRRGVPALRLQQSLPYSTHAFLALALLHLLTPSLRLYFPRLLVYALAPVQRAE